MKITELFDLSHTLAKDYLLQFEYGWQALKGISYMITELGKTLDSDYEEKNDRVWIHKSASIAPSAFIGAPCIIGKNSEVRHGAFIRGSALIGENCVIGNSTEVKNAIVFDGVQIPHFNYIGDSILGYKAHFGAGSVTSNVKSDKSLVCVKSREVIATGIKKFGALVGDFTEIGCNTVLNPGTVIGKNCTVYPLSNVRGVIDKNCIYKNALCVIPKEERNG